MTQPVGMAGGPVGAASRDAALQIVVIPDLRPLPAQSDETERPVLPEALHEAVFGGSRDIYAIVDAAKIDGLPEMIEASGLPARCLMGGVSQEDYGEVAPWLVQLAPGNAFPRRFMTEGDGLAALWSRQAVLFLRSDASLEALARHFRRLIRVAAEDGPELYFRFWDPAVAFAYLPGISDWPERVASIFWSRHAVVSEIIATSADEGVARRFVPRPAPGAPEPSVPFVLTGRDRALLQETQWPRLRDELAAWLPRADAPRFRGFKPAHRRALADHAITEGRRFGFRFKEEFAYFLYMMFFLGGWFHTAPHYAHLLEPLNDQSDARYSRMRHGFPEAYRAMFGALGNPLDVMAALHGRLSQTLAARGGWDGVTVADVLDVTGRAERAIALDGDLRGRARAMAMQECDALGLQGRRDRAVYYAHWLLLGPQIHRDPVYPWAGEVLLATGTASEGILPMAAYAHRRLGRTLSIMRRHRDAQVV